LKNNFKILVVVFLIRLRASRVLTNLSLQEEEWRFGGPSDGVINRRRLTYLPRYRMATTSCFFAKQTNASKIKSEIVSKYFSAWANVIASQGRPKIGYLDLFSGPGRYDDGKPSTPLIILENAINHWNAKVRNTIQITFNDADPQNVTRLKREIKNFNNLHRLKIPPEIYELEVDSDFVRNFDNMTTIPTLSFIDPWGYKGLSLPLVRSLIKDWGCDSIFFFNYRRINPGIENEVLEKPISDLFTEEVLLNLRERVSNKSPREREEIVLHAVEDVFRGWGMNYVLPFPFKNKTGKRTTHYLIFVTKSDVGFSIMKEIMAKVSSSEIQGVPSFEYNPAAARCRQLTLFKFEKPLDELQAQLLRKFSGKSLSMIQIYEGDHVGKKFIKKNYKAALINLESQGKIKTNRGKRKARKGSFPDDMIAIFPVKRS
jgi:three-Cys-motif partner protein